VDGKGSYKVRIRNLKTSKDCMFVVGSYKVRIRNLKTSKDCMFIVGANGVSFDFRGNMCSLDRFIEEKYVIRKKYVNFPREL